MRRVPGLAIQPATVATGRYVVILAKENAALRDRVDGILMDAMRDGTPKRIFETWNVWDAEQAAFQERMKETEEKRKISLNGKEAGAAAGALRAGEPLASAGPSPSSPSRKIFSPLPFLS